MIHPIPPGTRDVLPDEMRELRVITAALGGAFERAGYGEVFTPALEYEEVLRTGDAGAAGAGYRMFDEQGQVLALRSDMTIPIARLVATRFRDAEGAATPVLLRPRLPGGGARLRPAARVPAERHRADRRPGRRGGGGGDRADAHRAGRGRPGAPPGGPGRRRAVPHCWTASRCPKSAARPLLDCLSQRDLVTPGRHVDRAGPGARRARPAAAHARAARRPGGAGDRRRPAGSSLAREALDGLRELLQALSERGVADRVILDLGLVLELSYYTGAVYRGVRPGRGLRARRRRAL